MAKTSETRPLAPVRDLPKATGNTVSGPPLQPEDKIRRLSVPITADGKLDEEAIMDMRASTREALRRAFTASPSATSRLLGAPLTVASGTSPEFLSPERAARAFDVISVVMQGTIGRRYPSDIAAETLVFTDADKAALGPSMAAVLNKRAGPFLSKWGDEIELLGLTTSLLWAKVALANAMLAARDAARTRPTAVPFPPQPAAPECSPYVRSNPGYTPAAPIAPAAPKSDYKDPEFPS